VPITVRVVRPDDLDAVAELTARVYLGDGHSGPEYEPQLRDVASRAARATVLVAELHGRLAGTVTVATQGGPWAEQAVPGEAVIRMLAVDPAARGCGAGEALVRACLEAARADGCSVVRLSSLESMTAAHRLYERLGFVRTPSHDWSPLPGLLLRTYALTLAAWCGQCGEPLLPEGHVSCRRAAELDPPRYCEQCRRRRVVQVTPTGWTARCSEHGSTASTSTGTITSGTSNG
jgi:ribosomal protein S18 acetylase RimI-like enzyme